MVHLGRYSLAQYRVLSDSQAKSEPTDLTIPKLKRPNHVPKDEEWFWSKEWQKGEREVNKALANGEYKTFESADDFIKELHSHV